jgi:hypothetical protein
MNEQYYKNFLSRPVRFLVHKIVLQFCVFPINLPPVLVVLFLMTCYWFTLRNPVMGGTCLRYLHSTWGPVI